MLPHWIYQGPSNQDRTLIVLACIAVSVAQLGVGLLLPALPAISEDLRISPAEAQWYVSIYLLGFAVSQLIYGPLSDAWGRRPILLLGLFITLLGALLCLYDEQSPRVLLAGRLLQGVGAGSASVLARAMIRDRFEGKALSVAIAYIGIAAALTPAIAPFIGGYLSHHYGWPILFVSMAGYIFLVWGLIFGRFGETRSGERRAIALGQVVGGYRALFMDRYFLGYAGLNCVFFCLWLLMISVMPYLLQQQIGMDASDYGRWSLIPALSSMFGSFVSNLLRHRLNQQHRLQLSYLLLALAAGTFLVAPLELFWLILAQSLFAMAFGIGFMMSITCLLMPYKRNSGAVSALAGCLQMLLSSLGCVLLVELGVNTPMTFGTVMALGLLLCLLLHRLAQGAPLNGDLLAVDFEGRVAVD